MSIVEYQGDDEYSEYSTVPREMMSSEYSTATQGFCAEMVLACVLLPHPFSCLHCCLFE